MYVQIPSGNFYRYTFIVEIKHIGQMILLSVIVPGILITFLGMMYILIEKGSGDRISFITTILLTQVMFLVIITSFVPLTKQVPYFAQLFLAYVTMLAFLTFIILGLEKVHHLLEKKYEETPIIKTLCPHHDKEVVDNNDQNM